ncbi:hypothetical protein LTR36_004728 [Oleoguttula mirabilis]|uniref:SprT-like domain-containing protein n=1 Tax=Oleoguttula mirabilis TaxID=1507867 RepID=A0AAV9JF84_9PEZI|nr:hypothetical protein LTR36_004728 [Oleoguttula mirabilis]
MHDPAMYPPARHARVPWLFVDNPASHRQFTPEAHESLELATRAVERCERQEFAYIDKWAAVVKWHEWRQGFGVILEMADLSGMDESVLIAPFQIFNRYFFGGSIQRARLRWGLRDLRSQAGWAASCRVNHGGGDVLITLGPEHRNRIQGDVVGLSPFDSLMGDLLHEMVHAFLGRYSCVGYTCESVECLGLSEANIRRNNSHGRAWWRLAQAIEAEAQRAFGIAADLTSNEEGMDDRCPGVA